MKLSTQSKYLLSTKKEHGFKALLPILSLFVLVSIGLVFLPKIALAECPDFPAYATVVNGGQGDYKINGNKVYVFKGNFTGNISELGKNARIYVDAAATFKPQNFQNVAGEVINCGSVNLNNLNPSSNFKISNYGAVNIGNLNAAPNFGFTNYGLVVIGTLNTATGFTLTNFKEVTFNGSINFNGQSYINNMTGATLNYDKGFNLSSDSKVTNDGTIIQKTGGFTLNSGKIINYGYLSSSAGNASINGSIENFGVFTINGGTLTLNSAAGLINYCTVVAKHGIINNTTLENAGLILASQNSDNSITNNGRIINNGYIQGSDFKNNNAVNGKGSFYFTGHTSTQGSFANNAADDITFYDATSNSDKIFDQGQNVGKVKRSVVTPLPEQHRPEACSAIITPVPTPDDKDPLPVELVNFKGKLVNGNILLEWLTATEKNNEKFEVERSTDGLNFIKIGTIAGNGTTTHKNNYRFEDQRAPGNKTLYYRLNQVDFDGKHTYSKVIAVKTSNHQMVVTPTPNPFGNGDRVTLNITTNENTPVVLTLLNLAGNTMLKKQVQLNSGNSTLNLENLEQLTAGMYVLVLEYNGSRLQHKLLKK
ncbi:T9SS type A sorting domain-containing protein [Adhaeribacter rhizoryzae]|uniref:T9SS type A sorting domain-containing protein n=1 Tax=Adhaeribacter rhizoryzae TaxID=2607907 RepID=A0A5M6DS15_9BACT|nr:T9SS type A sorting domain-containing protein [Adhaeribacter rhizoryzae]KAA5549032.1 T9SS type A sorting domain-containing protein [Adhaeribacter rhizoryzae]